MTIRRLVIVTAILAISFGLRTWLSAATVIPRRQPLAGFPQKFGDWQMTENGSIPERLEGIVAADDYVLRTYRDAAGRSAGLFVAYYSVVTQGRGPHSPKNCLPGSGWEPVQNDRVRLEPDGSSQPFWVNRYVVEKDSERSLVLYWYRDQGRVIASEYWGMPYFIWDVLRTRRRDSALLRIMVSLAPSSKGAAETEVALNLARAALPVLPRFVPD